LASVVSEHEDYVVVRKEADAVEVVERLDERSEVDVSGAASE